MHWLAKDLFGNQNNSSSETDAAETKRESITRPLCTPPTHSFYGQLILDSSFFPLDGIT